jgi:hypothetical protein
VDRHPPRLFSFTLESTKGYRRSIMPVNEQLVEPGKHFAARGQVREVLEVLTVVTAAGDEMRKVRQVSYREGGNRNEIWTDLTVFAQEVEKEVRASS